MRVGDLRTVVRIVLLRSWNVKETDQVHGRTRDPTALVFVAADRCSKKCVELMKMLVTRVGVV